MGTTFTTGPDEGSTFVIDGQVVRIIQSSHLPEGEEMPLEEFAQVRGWTKPQPPKQKQQAGRIRQAIMSLIDLMSRD